ncbi:MAG: hypothetical protein ACOCVF_03330 [bacterium]
MAQVRNHRWTKDDAILTLYYVKFGVKNLPVRDDKEFAESIIGSSYASLQMQSANIRHILGYDEFTLADYSKAQSDVVEMYGKIDRQSLHSIVLEIIDKKDVKENIINNRKKRIEKETTMWKEKSQSDLEAAFRRMGKDPKKMKRLIKK